MLRSRRPHLWSRGASRKYSLPAVRMGLSWSDNLIESTSQTETSSYALASRYRAGVPAIFARGERIQERAAVRNPRKLAGNADGSPWGRMRRVGVIHHVEVMAFNPLHDFVGIGDRDRFVVLLNNLPRPDVGDVRRGS